MTEKDPPQLGSPKVVTEVTVKRRLGLLSCISFLVGCIIGSGIFISPTGVLRNTGSVGLCLIIWFVCGIISLCCSLVYIELASLIPTSGGEHTYYSSTFGSYPAFVHVWIQCIAHYPGSITLRCLTLAEYLSLILYDKCGPPIYAKKLIAYFALLTITMTNCSSVRLTARIQIIFTVLKIVGLMLIIVGGIVWIKDGYLGSLTTGFEDTIIEPENIGLAVYAGLWAYEGWSGLNNVVEEIVNPKRTIPLAIFISLAIVTSVYLLVNISYLSVLSKETFLSTWAVGGAWGEIVLSGAVSLIPLIVAASVYGSSNGSLFHCSRLTFAASRHGHFPEVFSYLHVDTLIPIPANILTHVTAALMLVSGDIGSLLNLLSFLTWFFYGLSMLVLIILRFKMKEAKRTIKVPLYIPMAILLICVYLTVAPFLSNPKIEFLYAVGYLAVGTLLFFPFVLYKWKVPGWGNLTRFVQLWMNLSPPSGGKNL